MEVINGSLVSRAIELYDSLNIDFVDAYDAALMDTLGIADVYSFNRKHLDGIDVVSRPEPRTSPRL